MLSLMFKIKITEDNLKTTKRRYNLTVDFYEK